MSQLKLGKLSYLSKDTKQKMSWELIASLLNEWMNEYAEKVFEKTFPHNLKGWYKI